ncbi:multiheme c-type cytochrome [Kolteria novifilia]
MYQDRASIERLASPAQGSLWRLLAALAVLGTGIAVVVGGHRVARSEVPAVESTPIPQFIGVDSCASASCHGDVGSAADSSCAYTTWASNDPHARAYQVLFNERSQQMLSRLGIAVDDTASPAYFQALREQRCLYCHGTATPSDGGVEPDEAIVSQGVGCEMCHGPARQWLLPHFQDPHWSDRGPAEKSRLGMVDMANLPLRVRTCTKCHVGASGMDVNHDLIAAGHPRLTFEAAAYHALWPKHWDYAEQRLADPGLPTQLWKIGQQQSAVAATELLHQRAQHAADGGTWPELAEYDCYACHHSLADQAWRKRRYESEGLTGGLPWNEWYTAMLPSLATGTASPQAHAALNSLKKLRNAMTKGDYPTPSAQQVADTSREALNRLQDWIASEAAAPVVTGELIAAVGESGPTSDLGTWDAMTQRYLALVALADGARVPLSDPVYEDLRKLRKLLTFPTVRESIDQKRRTIDYDSPATFEPRDVQQLLEKIESRLIANDANEP